MAISARSRRSRNVSVGMLSSNLRHSSASSTGVLPVLTTCFGPAHRRGRIGRDDLADDQPVEQHAHGGELLLHQRRRSLDGLQLLYIGGDVMRPDRGERQAALLAPARRTGCRPGHRRGACADCGCWR